MTEHVMTDVHQLEAAILEHRSLYYQGTPKITDYEFDLLESQLRAIDPSNPVLLSVGHQPNQLKLKHKIPMLSLQKTYDPKDLLSFSQDPMICTYKIDGNSISLVYRYGELKEAKTRGDGYYGEDILSKVLHIASCPQSLPDHKHLDYLEIRGELYCTQMRFQELSDVMLSRDLAAPSNPRNIVAGVLSRVENIDLAQYFNFKAFDILGLDTKELKTEEHLLLHLKNLGLSLPPYETVFNLESIQAVIQKAQQFITTGDFMIDGLVFIINDRLEQLRLGSTQHHPRYKIAFKWQGETKNTRLLDIEWNTSRQGVVTPIGILEPVLLSGAMIQKVSLHNAQFVTDHNLKPGDLIEIIRSGEVIPKYLRTLSNHTTPSYKLPTNCPSCLSTLRLEGPRLNCDNTEACHAQIRGQILNWIQNVGIEDISTKRLDALITNRLIKDICDLYLLKKEDLLLLEGMEEVLSEKLISSIKKSKTLSLDTLLLALGIKGIGRSSSRSLIRVAPRLVDLLSLDEEKILSIHGLGAKSAQALLAGLKDRGPLIDRLMHLGIELDTYAQDSIQTFEGCMFVITGKLTRPRQTMIEMIEKQGGRVTSSVSPQTTALITNEPASLSSKNKKAQAIGIPIWSEEQLFNKLKKNENQ